MAKKFTEYRSPIKYLIVFCLFTVAASAQTSTQFYSKDFNEDGSSDDLVVNFLFGTLDYAIYTDGLTKTQYKFQFQRLATKHGIVKITPIPPYFTSEKGEKALPKIDSLIFKIPLTKSVDNSLVWLLDNYITKEKSSSKYFNQQSSFQPTWSPYKPSMPNNYRIKSDDTTLLFQIYRSHQLKDTSTSAYITYLGKYHTRAISMTKSDVNIIYPLTLDSTPTFKLYQSAHGVFIKKDSLYSWVFVSDGGLYNNIQKLEWESIQQVAHYKDFVIVLNQPYPAIKNNMYIVDWKRGKTFEINRDFIFENASGFNYIDNFEVIENQLFLFVKSRPSAEDYKQISIDLSPITEEIGKIK